MRVPISCHKWRGLTVFDAAIYAAMWAFACAIPGAASAVGNAPGVFMVHASVSPSAAFKSRGRFSIGASDIARGLIEIPISSLFSVNTGKSIPVASIEFQPRDELLRSVAIKSGEESAPKEFQAAGDQQPLGVEDLNMLPSTAAGVATSLDLENGKAIAGSGREAVQQKRVSSALLSLRFNFSENARSGSYTIPFVVSFQL